MKPSPSDTIRIWHVVSADALTLHSWSARALVYNDLSGHTHLLDEMSTVAFESILAGPLSEDDLVVHLAEIFDLPIDARLEQWSHQALLQLENLGLIASKRREAIR